MKLEDYFDKKIPGRLNRTEFGRLAKWNQNKLSRICLKKYRVLSVNDIKTIINLTNNLVSLDDL